MKKPDYSCYHPGSTVLPDVTLTAWCYFLRIRMQTNGVKSNHKILLEKGIAAFQYSCRGDLMNKRLKTKKQCLIRVGFRPHIHGSSVPMDSFKQVQQKRYHRKQDRIIRASWPNKRWPMDEPQSSSIQQRCGIQTMQIRTFILSKPLKEDQHGLPGAKSWLLPRQLRLMWKIPLCIYPIFKRARSHIKRICGIPSERLLQTHMISL